MEKNDLDSLLFGLGINKKYLLRLLYDRKPKYCTFKVTKKSGGEREIEAPFEEIKAIQEKFLKLLYSIYSPRGCVHGFCRGKSIATNAKMHVGKRYVVSIDLKDFFHSINFYRILGLLKCDMYRFGHEVAAVIAHAACHNKRLPMGGVMSPIISNMMAGSLDMSMKRLARIYQMSYSRYADDLTFSSNRDISADFLCLDPADNRWRGEVVDEILKKGFFVNENKIRIKHCTARQEVTGVIVNKKLNIRRSYVDRIRGALHAWEVYGENKAQTRLIDLVGHKVRIRNYISGMLAHLNNVKGRDDVVFQKLMKRFMCLCGEDYLAGFDWNYSGVLLVYDDYELEIGTAFAINDNKIVTCAHVAKEAMYIAVQAHMKKYVVCANIINYDADIAILEVGDEFNFNKIKKYKISSVGLMVQDKYTFAGFPNYIGGTHTVMSGNIAAKIPGNNDAVGYLKYDHYKLDKDVIGGASGAPLFDRKQQVCGIITRGLTDGGEKGETDSNLAVDIRYFKEYADNKPRISSQSQCWCDKM